MYDNEEKYNNSKTSFNFQRDILEVDYEKKLNDRLKKAEIRKNKKEESIEDKEQYIKLLNAKQNFGYERRLQVNKIFRETSSVCISNICAFIGVTQNVLDSYAKIVYGYGISKHKEIIRKEGKAHVEQKLFEIATTKIDDNPNAAINAQREWLKRMDKQDYDRQYKRRKQEVLESELTVEQFKYEIMAGIIALTQLPMETSERAKILALGANLAQQLSKDAEMENNINRLPTIIERGENDEHTETN